MNRSDSTAVLAPAVLAWITAVAAALLAVGTQPWAQTLLVALLGLHYLLFPPRQAMPWSIVILGALLFLVAISAFLPAGGMDPTLRAALRDHGIAVAATRSLQPWLSLEDLVLLTAGLFWAWACLRIDLIRRQRETLVDGYLVVLGLIALGIVLHGRLMAWGAPAWLGNLGQFANRNQTGDILVAGGIFSLVRAFSHFNQREWSALFWFGLTLLFMVAIVENGSRAAVLLFALGSLVLIGWRMLDQPSAAVAGSTLSLLAFAALMAMAATGFAVVHRFGPLLAGGGGEGRIAIYRDAAQVATRAPWFGFGLGNFEGVFNLLRVQSAGSMTRMIHPESDWWWLAVETGFLGVGLAGMLVALVFRFLFVDVHQRGLAKGSAVLALLFLIHSFFDVGGHRMGTLWSCTYLVGLGIGAAEVRGGCVMPALLFRTAGLLFLGLAALRCQSDGLHPWMPTRASAEAVELALRQSPAPPAQKELLDRAIAWAPLAWNPYFERGLLGLQQGDTAAAEADFDRALYLEQSTIEVPRAIGQACRQLDPAEALTAWQELMRRAGDRRDNVYWVLLISIPDPKQRLQVSAFAGDDPDLQAIAVIWQSPENFDWMRRNFLQTNPSLAGVRPLRARQLFDRWNEIGDANELITAWPQHPEWKAPGWRAYVRALARTGAYDRAVQETLDEIPAPAEPSLPRDETLDEAAQDFRDNPADPYRGLMLYRFQLAAGQTDAARATLQQAGTMPSPPAALRYLLAQALLRDGQAEAAWKAAAPLLETDSP